jgi:hypothetical protein
MNFFKEEKLYRVEIIKICPLPSFKNVLFNRSYYGIIPSADTSKQGNFGCIPIGTKGWIIKKWGKEYFSPDKGQKGLELFTNSEENGISLIPHRKVKAFYQIAS